jgi:hypothetical protein
MMLVNPLRHVSQQLKNRLCSNLHTKTALAPSGNVSEFSGFLKQKGLPCPNRRGDPRMMATTDNQLSRDRARA